MIDWSPVLLSLRVGLSALAVIFVLGTLAARAMTRRHFPGKDVVDGLLVLPLVLPPVVTGFLLLVLLGRNGPVGRLMEDAFGVRLLFTLHAAVLAAVVVAFPLMYQSAKAAFQSVDTRLEDAARTLGAGPWDRFFTVTLPLMLPGVLAGAVTAFSAGLGEFGAVITFVSNIPGETRTLPLALYTALQTPGGDAIAARLAMISFALGLLGLIAAEFIARRVRHSLGR